MRFRCLANKESVLRFSATKCVSAILACEVLHNIAQEFHLDMPSLDCDPDIVDDADAYAEVNANIIDGNRAEALTIVHRLIQRCKCSMDLCFQIYTRIFNVYL